MREKHWRFQSLLCCGPRRRRTHRAAADENAKDSPELAMTARELAPHLAALSFPPDAEPVSGTGPVVAEALSRVVATTGLGSFTSDYIW